MDFSSGYEAEDALFERLIRVFPQKLTHLGPMYDDNGSKEEVTDVLVILGDTLIAFQSKWKNLDATDLDEIKRKRVMKVLNKGVGQHRTLLSVLDRKLAIFDKNSSETIEPWSSNFSSIYLVTVLALSDAEYQDPARRFYAPTKVEHRKKTDVHCLLLNDVEQMLEYLTTPGDFVWYLNFRLDAETNCLIFKNELDALMVFKKDLFKLRKNTIATVQAGYFEESENEMLQSDYIEYSRLYESTVDAIERSGILAEVGIAEEPEICESNTTALYILGLLSLVNRGERYYFSESVRAKLPKDNGADIDGCFVLTCSQGGFIIGVNISSGFSHNETINGTVTLCCTGMAKTRAKTAVGMNLRFEGDKMYFDALHIRRENVRPFDEFVHDDLLADPEQLRTYHQSLDSDFKDKVEKWTGDT